jgi:sigma-E factor negative regulatory protein RseB
MLLRSLSCAALGLAAALLVPMAQAQADKEVSPAETKVWLQRIHAAASERNYRGTLVTTAGGAVTSSSIAHYCEGPNRYERIEPLDGQMRRVFRRDDAVYTLWPERRIAVVEERAPLVTFPSLLSGGEGTIVERYRLLVEGMDRVAGHEAQVLTLQPRDEHRYAQRIWADKASGLLLRADILDHRGGVLESASFSDVTVDVRPQPEAVTGPLKKLDGWHLLRSTYARTRLEDEGWALPSPVAGFREISCVKRALQATQAGGASEGEVVQTIFSDGLTHVSVFIEPFDEKRHLRQMHAAVGATHTLTRRHDQWWVTVVGDVPMPTLKMFAAGLERRR